MEMLVVLGIIAVVLAIALPNIRMKEGSEMDAATRQLIADLALARAKAIGGRTTVAVVFVPPGLVFWDLSQYSKPEQDEIRKLQAGIYTQYALFSFRRVGDQPGRNTARYLSEWKTLPEKTFIAEDKFGGLTDIKTVEWFDYYRSLPFPFANSPGNAIPYVAFNFEGRPCTADGSGLTNAVDIHIPLARGVVDYTRDAGGTVTEFKATEIPDGNSLSSSNHVVIDYYSGRARLVRAEAK